MRPLNFRQRLFIEFYLGESSGSATDAARRAGYRAPHPEGARLLRRPSIRAAIDARVAEAATTGHEVLARVADIANSNLLDFLDLSKGDDGTVSLKMIKQLGLGHVVKRIRTRKDGTREIEFESKLPALLKLGDYFRLWDRDGQPQLTLVDLAKSLKEKYDQLRAKGDDEEPAGPVQELPESVQ